MYKENKNNFIQNEILNEIKKIKMKFKTVKEKRIIHKIMQSVRT